MELEHELYNWSHNKKIFNQFFGIENKENKIPEFKLKIAVYLLT